MNAKDLENDKINKTIKIDCELWKKLCIEAINVGISTSQFIEQMAYDYFLAGKDFNNEYWEFQRARASELIKAGKVVDAEDLEGIK
jgi:hypothetical protein